jgi:hypothetical protein
MDINYLLNILRARGAEVVTRTAVAVDIDEAWKKRPVDTFIWFPINTDCSNKTV